MAQDILITPGSGEPQILFRGSGTTDTTIELNVISSQQSQSLSGSGTTTLSFEGTEGQLLGVTDNLSSGTIFSVSDITGLPLIEVDATGDVKIGEYGRYVGIGSGIAPGYGLDVFSSGHFHKGFILAAYTPATTTNALYHEDGMLKFNGKILTSGVAAHSDTTYTAGDGLTLTSTDFDLDAALTTVTSLLATDIKIGEDDQTKIDFETANEIHFYAANVEQIYLADNIFGPQADSDVDLGTTGERWKDAYIDTITTTSHIACGGEIKTATVSYTDGDDAITINDGGSITLAKAVKGAIATATEDATVVIDLRDSNYFEITLGANVTDIDFTNGSVGQRFVIRFEQPAGANYSIVYSAVTHDADGGGSPATVTVSWPGGTAPTMTATNDKADTYGFIVRAEGHFDGYVIGQNISETTN